MSRPTQSGGIPPSVGKEVRHHGPMVEVLQPTTNAGAPFPQDLDDTNRCFPCRCGGESPETVNEDGVSRFGELLCYRIRHFCGEADRIDDWWTPAGTVGARIFLEGH